MIDVYIAEQPEGWVLTTTDTARDILAGPFTDKDEAVKSAEELGLHLLVEYTPKQKKLATAQSLPIGHVFHAEDGMWYRYVRRDGRKCVVDVLGQNRQTEIIGDTKVTEISVLSLK